MKKNLVSTNPGVTVSRPEYKCYQCGEGHKKKDCPYWPKDPTVCWKCHSVGHMHRDCKNVVEKATQTPQKMPMFCRKERELRQPNLLERQQRQQEEEVYVEMKGREEGGQAPSVVRRVTFEETPVERERGHVPAASPEKCLTPRVSTSKYTPIVFMDDPKSPDPSPLSRADASSSSPEVGNSP